MKRLKPGGFLSVVITLIVVFSFAKWGIPAISRQITALPFPLPVPGTLMFFYMTLTVVALFMVVTFSEEGFEDFQRPIRRFLRGDFGTIPLIVVLVALPVLGGWIAYSRSVPQAMVPASLRIQHPSSNFPVSFESKKNPVAEIDDGELDAFIEQVKANEVEFIPQVQADIEAWADENEPDHMLEFLPAEPVKKLLEQVNAGGEIDREVARAALHEKDLFEGRALYAMNCRACHGDSAGGDGPMADGFKLRPINFTDNGTVETIVEGYTFWRVTNGGPGLPTEATPWDSAMPEWKLSLTEDQRWRIIQAEYDIAEKTPRIPEGHE